MSKLESDYTYLVTVSFTFSLAIYKCCQAGYQYDVMDMVVTAIAVRVLACMMCDVMVK